MSTITIPIEQYECLREHLTKANEIFNSLGMVGSGASERKASKPYPKETKPQKVKKYADLLSSGKRVTKPNYLKKS
jgi:hypothetical protein